MSHSESFPNEHSSKRTALQTAAFTNPRFTQIPYKLYISVIGQPQLWTPFSRPAGARSRELPISTEPAASSPFSCVGAARTVSPDWSQKTIKLHFNCFSIFWVRVRHHWWLLFLAAATWPSRFGAVARSHAGTARKRRRDWRACSQTTLCLLVFSVKSIFLILFLSEHPKSYKFGGSSFIWWSLS